MTMQSIKPKVGTLNLEDGKKLLEEELESCTDAEYVFSNVTDLSDREIKIPAILLKKNLKNKDKYPGVAMHSNWSMINVGTNEREAWMFLNIDFEELGTLKFKFNLYDPNMREWIETLILSDGNAVLCDKNKKTNFDIGLSNIPLDIPLAQMTLTALFMQTSIYLNPPINTRCPQ